MKRNFIVTLLLIFVLAACLGPIPVSHDIQYCQTAETHLKALCNQDPINNKTCCDMSKPTLKGKSFTQFCTETMTNGVDLHPRCLSQITKCTDINVCVQGQ